MKNVSLQVCVLALCAALCSCSNPADDKPAAVVSDPTPQPAAPAAVPAAAVYRIAEGSKIGFVGSKVTGSHDGGFNEFDGTITVVDGDPAKSSVEVAIDTTSLWADNERLTEHLKSPDFFDVAAHPRAEFRSTSIVPAPDGYTLTGNLALHGVEKTISFPAKIAVSDTGVTATAEFSIKRFDFGIVYAGKADDLIRDEVLIRLDLVAEPTGATGT